MSKLIHLLFKPVDHVLLQVPRALVASILAALLQGGCLFLLVETCGWDPVAAAVLGYLVGGLLQYILCSIWVFPDAPKNKTVGFVAFTLLSLGGLVITWAVMETGAWLRMPYGLSWFGALGLTFVWNFTSRKYFLFERKDSSLPQNDAPPQGSDYSDWITTVAQATAVCSRSSPDVDESTELMARAASSVEPRKHTGPLVDMGR